MDGYLAIVLTEDSQKSLLEKIPPSYATIYAHHVTVAFKPTLDAYDSFKEHLGKEIILRVYGYSKDDKAEAILVEIDILKDRQNHITISTNNVAPFYSKTLVEKGHTPIAEPFDLKGVFEFIEHKPRN